MLNSYGVGAIGGEDGMARRWFCLAPALLAFLMAALFGQAVGQTATTLRIAVMTLPPTAFPFDARTSDMRYLRGFIGRSLTIYDKSWAVACALCTELPTLENGGARIVARSDGTKGIDVTFSLDPGLAWDDGVPVTAADVLFSIEIAHKFGVGASALRDILDATALDEHRFTLHLATVRFDYNRMEDLFLLPVHREKVIFEGATSFEDYKARSLYTTDPASPGLSYGPFKIEKVSPDTIELGRNAYWHGKQPSLDRVALRKFSDIGSIVEDLLAKKIDMASGDTTLDLDGVYQLEETAAGSNFGFIFKLNLEYGHIDINLSNPLLQSKALRKAMLLALDRPITGSQHEDKSIEVAPTVFLPPTSPNFDPTLKPAPYDPEKAKALLDSAGFIPGPDGIRVDAKGRRLAFRLASSLDLSVNRRVVEKVRSQWRAVGIEVTPENKNLREILPHRDFDLAAYSWSNTPEFQLEPVYGKSGIPTAENSYSGLNFPGFDNAEMNRVVAALNTEMDPAKRLLLWQRAQEIYAEELPALPLFFGVREYIVPASMTGVEPTGHMIPTSYWVEDWRLH
jgi:peptide/nickel transport system substrate-binding protein